MGRVWQGGEEIQIRKTLLRIIWIGIQNWIHQDFDKPLVKGDNVSNVKYDAIKKVYGMQAVIGQDHFVAGKIEKGWKEYYTLRLPDSKEKAEQVIAFSRTMVASIWVYTLMVQKSHNKGVHDKRGSFSDRQIYNLKRCRIDIYETIHTKVNTEDEWLFREEARTRVEQPVPQI